MIEKTALDENQSKNLTYFDNSARACWKLVLKSLPNDSKVLLPSYIGFTQREGSGIYDPIVETKLEHDFYSLNEDLSINAKSLENDLKKGDYQLILLVHYFGLKIENLQELVDLAHKYNVQVVEDCAHLYNYNQYEFSDAGTYGDYVFYSLHKNFPIKEGGLLVQNNHSLECIQKATENNPQLGRLIFDYDVKSIITKKIENYVYLQNRLIDNPYIDLLKPFAVGDIPHTFPIIVKSGLREKAYFAMIEKGFTLIALYYRMIEPIYEQKIENTIGLSNSILNLPIHQDVTIVELDALISALEEVLIKLNK